MKENNDGDDVPGLRSRSIRANQIYAKWDGNIDVSKEKKKKKRRDVGKVNERPTMK